MAGRGALKNSAKSGLYLNDRGEKQVIESKFQNVVSQCFRGYLLPVNPSLFKINKQRWLQ